MLRALYSCECTCEYAFVKRRLLLLFSFLLFFAPSVSSPNATKSLNAAAAPSSCYRFPIHTVATLGIVESGIFLLIKYYEGLDLTKEKVFANIHFLLFG